MLIVIKSKRKDELQAHLDVDPGPEVEEGGGRVGVASPGRQVERSVAAEVHLVQLQPVPRHLLAEPAGDTVLTRYDSYVRLYSEFNIGKLFIREQCKQFPQQPQVTRDCKTSPRDSSALSVTKD